MKQAYFSALIGLAMLMTAEPQPAQAQDAAPALTSAQLQTLVAPIALYPDPLISLLLPASAYPLEIVQAERWLEQNGALQKSAPDQFSAQLDGQSWDPSVKALTNFPAVLSMMNDKLDWTSQLGDAFVNQQKEVLAAVQAMRAKAQSAGSLKSTPQQRVLVQGDYIEVEPANPQVVYVPTYNPAVVYAAPAYGDGWAAGALSFGLGVAMGAAWTGGCNWDGGYVNNVNINNFYGHRWRDDRWYDNHPWRPDPARRQAARGGGVPGGDRPPVSPAQISSELENRGWDRGAADGARAGSFTRAGGGFEADAREHADDGERRRDLDGVDHAERDAEFGDHDRMDGFKDDDFMRGGGFHGGGGHMGRR